MSPNTLEMVMLSNLENVYSYFQNLLYGIAISFLFFPKSKMGVKMLFFICFLA